MMSLLFISTQISMYSIMLSHPLAMAISLLIQSMSFSMITSLILINFWYAYMFFLMMISGMLILFMYMTSISSNSKFNMSKLMMVILTMSITLMIFSTIKTQTLLKINFSFMLIPSINLMFNPPLIMMMMIMIIYLLLTLITTVKIVNTNTGPLRQKF